MNEKTKDVAERVRKLSNIPEEEKFGSVIAILMVISIILTLVRVLQECNKNKLDSNSTQQDKYSLYGAEMKSYSIKRGWFTKLRIKRVIKKNMSKDQYSKYGQSLLDAILDTGKNLQDDEVVGLVESANA
jgi:hypothetical protein